jgi:hypothetical protein
MTKLKTWHNDLGARLPAYNYTYKKLAFQWLNLPAERQVKLYASYQVLG